MKRQWLPLNAFRAFEAAAKCLSFTHGAEQLNVVQSAVSRHVAGLEELLGQKLFIRKQSGLELTKAGEALLPAVTRSFNRLEQAMAELRVGAPRGGRVLKVHFPPSFLHQVALPLMAEFRALHPDIAIEIFSSYAPGVPKEDYDIAVVFDRPRVSEAIRDLLWMVEVTPGCSPALAAQARDLSIDAFLRQSELLHVRVEGNPVGHLWSHFANRAGIMLDDNGGGSTFDTLLAAAQYAMSGQGVVLLDIDMFAREIAEGKLVAPWEVRVESGYGYYLSLAADDLQEPIVATFRSWIISRFAVSLGKRQDAADSDAG
jgi:DNA-binding transcriptional LysR family regulator